jgi:hypothetical protein
MIQRKLRWRHRMRSSEHNLRGRRINTTHRVIDEPVVQRIAPNRIDALFLKVIGMHQDKDRIVRIRDDIKDIADKR